MTKRVSQESMGKVWCHSSSMRLPTQQAAVDGLNAELFASQHGLSGLWLWEAAHLTQCHDSLLMETLQPHQQQQVSSTV